MHAPDRQVHSALARRTSRAGRAGRAGSKVLALAVALASGIGAIAAVDPAPASARVRVVASTTDLASIAADVGGDFVEVSAIAKPSADPHRVEVLPSYMVRVSRADVYLKVGLGLDAWADAVIDGSRNGSLAIVDCSAGVRILEKPEGKVDASMGDVHPGGNPHYWLDPRNAAIAAMTIASALAERDAAHAGAFHDNARAFASRAESMVTGHAARGGARRAVVTYHRSWSYFADAFGFDVVATIEPVPGIPPTARHLNDVLATIRERNVVAVIQEPYFSNDAADFLERETGVRVIRESPSCEGTEAGAYLLHVDGVLRALGAPGGK